MSTASLAKDGRTLTVRVPLTLKRRGGRKLVIVPDGAAWAPRRRVDSTMVKAIARGFRWRKYLETGVYGTVGEISAAERINPSYVSRILRLTLLAPETVEAILDGRQPVKISLATLMMPFPACWQEQKSWLAFAR